MQLSVSSTQMSLLCTSAVKPTLDHTVEQSRGPLVLHPASALLAFGSVMLDIGRVVLCVQSDSLHAGSSGRLWRQSGTSTRCPSCRQCYTGLSFGRYAA